MHQTIRFTHWWHYILATLFALPLLVSGQSNHPKAILSQERLAELQSQRNRPEYQNYIKMGQAYLSKAVSRGSGGYAIFAAIRNRPVCLPVTASTHDGNGPENVLDGDLTTRWSAEGDGEWIEFCLEEAKTIKALDIAFYNGDQRIATFDIRVSDDAVNWSVVGESFFSSGASVEPESFSFDPVHAKYVQIIGHGNSINTWNSITEVQIVEDTGIVDCQPVIASANDGAGSVAENVLDNDPGTRWSAEGDGQWIQFCLQEVEEIGALDISFHQGDQRIATFDIRVSADGANWTAIGTTFQSSGNSLDLERFYFAPVEAKYVQIIGHGNSINNWNSLTEVEIIEASIIVECFPVVASSDDGAGSVAENVLDDNLATRWSAQGDGEWIQFCLGEIALVSGVDIAFHQGDQRTTSFDIQLSANGQNWTTVAQNLQSSGNYLHFEQFIFPSRQARFVRILGHGNSVNQWNSFTEVKIKIDITTEYVPGNSYFGTSDYIEYIAGDAPVIISVPHGGTLKPSEILDRSCNGCVYVNDSYTEDLGKEIMEAFYAATGSYPHVIINKLHRTKLDANRALEEAADGNAIAGQAWHEFHEFIDKARAEVVMTAGKGLYIDIHGHGHDIQRLELGYLLSKSDLQNNDDLLNTASYINGSSIQHLVQTNITSLTHAELLHGAFSFGTLTENADFASVPATTDPYPLDNEEYFRGGYNTRQYSSYQGGTIDGIQIECNRDVRFSESIRLELAERLASVMVDYLDHHYFSAFASIFIPFVQTASGKLMVNAVSDVKESVTSIEESSLEIYPNPFSSKTIIVYHVEEATEVRLTLYSPAGVKVRDIYSGRVNAGTGFYHLDAKEHEIKAGTYFLHMVTRDNSITRRIIYLE